MTIQPRSPEDLIAEWKHLKSGGRLPDGLNSETWFTSVLASLLAYAAQEALPEAKDEQPFTTTRALAHQFWNDAAGEYLDNLNELANKIAEG